MSPGGVITIHGGGWGLTTVNRIIGEHGGTSNFTSVVGAGTTFTIKLPLAREVVAGTPAPAPARTIANTR